MQDETISQRKSHALTLAPDDLLTGLSVFQIDQPHQQTLVQLIGQ